MRVLLARIGFMKFYKGPKPGDEKPIGGGKYNTEGIGHEAYNFLNVRGSLYGYFQPHMKSPYEINLGRIEQTLDMRLQPKYGWPLRCGVGAYPFKHARTIV